MNLKEELEQLKKQNDLFTEEQEFTQYIKDMASDKL